MLQIGIHELGLRRAILREVECMRDDDEVAAKKQKKLELPEVIFYFTVELMVYNISYCVKDRSESFWFTFTLKF